VRTKLFRARLGAMGSSHVYTFQYQPGSGSYRLSPQDNAAAAPAQGDESAKSNGDQGHSADDEEGPRAEEGALPDGIHFMADDAPDPDAADNLTQDVAQSNGGGGWSDPILFYPDGTTSDARFIVSNDRGYAIHIRLRGVTGNVALGDKGTVVE
jgi:hypothetical protein